MSSGVSGSSQHTDQIAGLSTAEAAARLARLGPNALRETPPRPWWRRVAAQFASPLIYILLFALAFDLAVWFTEDEAGWPIEAFAIALILLFNAGLGLYQEHRSEAALSRLRALAGSRAWVIRDGEFQQIATEALVPDDVVRLEAGDRVPADGRLVEAHGVMLDESMLTGESLPIDKTDDAEAFSGTLLTRGKALLVVTRTGASSAMGRLAAMLESIDTSPTPLERRVEIFGRQIARWVLALAVALGLLGILAEGIERAPAMIVFAVALAVAAVPEGLPAILTVTLALGVERMSRHNAVVRRLSAVEALGSVTVIATDKTGTLTENRMDVQSLDSPDLPRALRAMVLVNDASSMSAGDPLDLGFLRYAASQSVDVASARTSAPRLSERPFDSRTKFARVTVREEGRPVSYVKGAPEVVIDRCTLAEADRRLWREKAELRAREGLRVIAIAWGEAEAEKGLSLLGLAMLWDPPRAEVPDAVRVALSAGIRIVMITGDHPGTALAVAQAIGIPGGRVLTGDELDRRSGADLERVARDVNVFARVRPEQKLQLVELLQSGGQIVAMTGDGVNDAPALKRSDVGVAMGQRGSDVSREVADLVLLDDNFATIVRAVEEGRSIYENVQTFLRYLFSTNLSEVIVVACGAVVAFAIGLRDAGGALLLPLTAAQILWINLLTDGLPALALAFDRNPDVMRRSPRPTDAPLLDRDSARFIVAAGVMKAIVALAVLGFVPRLGYDLDTARAAAFHYLAIGQLLITYPSRWTSLRPLPNWKLHAVVLIGIGVQVAAAYLPFVATLLGNAALPGRLWLLVLPAAMTTALLAAGVASAIWRTGQPAVQPGRAANTARQ